MDCAEYYALAMTAFLYYGVGDVCIAGHNRICMMGPSFVSA